MFQGYDKFNELGYEDQTYLILFTLLLIALSFLGILVICYLCKKMIKKQYNHPQHGDIEESTDELPPLKIQSFLSSPVPTRKRYEKKQSSQDESCLNVSELHHGSQFHDPQIEVVDSYPHRRQKQQKGATWIVHHNQKKMMMTNLM